MKVLKIFVFMVRIERTFLDTCYQVSSHTVEGEEGRSGWVGSSEIEIQSGAKAKAFLARSVRCHLCNLRLLNKLGASRFSNASSSSGLFLASLVSGRSSLTTCRVADQQLASSSPHTHHENGPTLGDVVVFPIDSTIGILALTIIEDFESLVSQGAAGKAYGIVIL